MAYFPVFCDLNGREVLLYGGNRHILEKLEKLRSFGPILKVICPEPDGEVAAFPGVILERRTFRPEDLEDNPAMVIVSLEDGQMAETVSRACRQRNIPVNAVDKPELCSFYFPALIVEGDLTVGISTAGVSPAAAVVLKERIRKCIPSRAAEILRWVRQQREKTSDFPGKRDYLRRITARAMEKNRPLAEEELTGDVHIST